jgi:hypothetical protein
MARPLSDFNAQQQEFLTCKPSRLIMLAIEDLIRCETEKDKFGINMSIWVEERKDDTGNKRCYVCLAGSCLAQRFEVFDYYGSSEDLEETIIDGHAEEVEKRLEALNCFRTGEVFYGLRNMGIVTEDPQMSAIIHALDKKFDTCYDDEDDCGLMVPYHEPSANPEANAKFKEQLAEIATELAKIGL